MKIPSKVLKFVRVTTRESETHLIKIISDALVIGNDVVIDLGERTTVRQVYFVGINHNSPPIATKIRCAVSNVTRLITFVKL
jgi:hypothetical protein